MEKSVEQIMNEINQLFEESEKINLSDLLKGLSKKTTIEDIEESMKNHPVESNVLLIGMFENWIKKLPKTKEESDSLIKTLDKTNIYTDDADVNSQIGKLYLQLKNVIESKYQKG